MENKRPRTDEAANSILPEDAIIEIISRLAVKDLFPLMCVSKSWCSLITSDSYFSVLQLDASLERPFGVLKRVEDGNRYYNYMFDLNSSQDQNMISTLVEIDNPFDRQDPDNAPRQDGEIVASFDGLLVLLQRDTCALALLNPSTRKYHLVPPNPAGNTNVYFSGFGYDYNGEYHKIVTIVKPAQSHSVLDLMIYDSKNSTWRKIQSKPDGIESMFALGILDIPGTYADEYLFWHMYMKDGSLAILGFDIEFEEFFDTTLHDDFRGVEYSTCTKMVGFDDKLCLVCMWDEDNETWTRIDDEEERVDIWVLNVTYDEEKEEWLWFWTKLFSVSDPKFRLGMTDEQYITLLPQCYSACLDKVLFDVNYNKKLVWYNLETKEFEKFSNGVNDVDSFSVTTCVGSLIGNGLF